MADTITFPIRSDKLTMTASVKSRLCRRQTEFQTIEVCDTHAFGKVLLLDGHVQLATFDEFAYHEALVHIPLLSIEDPKRALVVGGGDGGVLRELVKHKSLTWIDMVDIDGGVIEASREFLPELSAGSFDNPIVHLHIQDAFPFVKQAAEPYDLIVVDVTDVYEEEDSALSERIFGKEFFEDCRAALAPAGFVVTQADNHVFCPYSMEDVLADFAAVFPAVGSYQALVPSFGGFSGFVWASHGAKLMDVFPSARAADLALRYLSASTYALALEGGSPGGFFGVAAGDPSPT